MPKFALQDMARQTAITIGRFAYHSAEDRQSLARLFRQFRGDFHVADVQGSRVVKSYRLQFMQSHPIGGFRRTTGGVVFASTPEARIEKDSKSRAKPKPHLHQSRAADLLPVGYFKGVTEGVDHKPQLVWTESPLKEVAAEGHLPLRISVEHRIVNDEGIFETLIKTTSRRKVFGLMLPDTEYRQRLMGAEEFARLLAENRHVRAALAKYPDSDVFLEAWTVRRDELELIGRTLGRTIHGPTGSMIVVNSAKLDSAVSPNSIQPFTISDAELQKFKSSLDTVGEELKAVGEELNTVSATYGWLTSVVFGEIQTVKFTR